MKEIIAPNWMHALRKIQNNPGIHLAKLARIMNITDGPVIDLKRLMLEKKWIKIETKKNKTIITLTAKGDTLANAASRLLIEI